MTLTRQPSSDFGKDVNFSLIHMKYEDEDHDKVILASDSDLIAAVEHAKLSGWKGLRLHLDYSGTPGRRRGSNSESLDYAHRESTWASAYTAVAAGAALAASLDVGCGIGFGSVAPRIGVHFIFAWKLNLQIFRSLAWMDEEISESKNQWRHWQRVQSSVNPAQDTETICFTDDTQYVDPDPGHSFEDIEASRNTSNSRDPDSFSRAKHVFVEQALTMFDKNLSRTVMRGFKPENVPIYATLVREFAVFDRWFSSIPGPTQPNRLFLYSATSHGSTSNFKKQLAAGYPQKTIFDSLHENGLDFGIYYLNNHHNNSVFRNLRMLKYVFQKFHQYDLKFKKDAKNGNLPNLTVIEPRYFGIIGYPANDDHPSHDIANGQKLVKEVYETLRANGNTGPAPSFFKFDRLGVHYCPPLWSLLGSKRKELVVSSPRTDCPEILAEVLPLRSTTEVNETRALSEFQSELVQLAALLNGDHFLSSFPHEMGKKMNVKEAYNYVRGAVSRFISASKEAIKLGADESCIVDMRSPLSPLEPLSTTSCFLWILASILSLHVYGAVASPAF
ncbi:hypothetical protein HAX54_003508 [Datura stramonium]|uniref:PB1 domain-containing protein n=1 Tax=Datura stramonium TaxID=4076 RepID=A0ABS8RTI7_DATST|nr:hypothetical protein [Datura stramonium]